MSNGVVAEGCRGPAIDRCVVIRVFLLWRFLACSWIVCVCSLSHGSVLLLSLWARVLIFVGDRLFCSCASLFICTRLCPCAIRVVPLVAVLRVFLFLRSRPFQLDGRPLIFMSSTLLVSGWLWWFFCLARRVAARRALLTWVVAAARLQAMWPEAVGQK